MILRCPHHHSCAGIRGPQQQNTSMLLWFLTIYTHRSHCSPPPPLSTRSLWALVPGLGAGILEILETGFLRPTLWSITSEVLPPPSSNTCLSFFPSSLTPYCLKTSLQPAPFRRIISSMGLSFSKGGSILALLQYLNKGITSNMGIRWFENSPVTNS